MNRPEWKASKKNGNVPFVWQSYPRGHKCLWTCIWKAGLKTLQPYQLIGDLALLSPEQKWYEIEDYSGLNIHANDLSLRCQAAILDYGKDIPGHIFEQLLQEGRDYVKLGKIEFFAHWDPPPKTFKGRAYSQAGYVWRPGWPVPQDEDIPEFIEETPPAPYNPSAVNL